MKYGRENSRRRVRVALSRFLAKKHYARNSHGRNFGIHNSSYLAEHFIRADSLMGFPAATKVRKIRSIT